MPDTENSRKTAEKGAEWVAVKQLEEQPEEHSKTVKTAVFRLFFWLFFSGFSAVFKKSGSLVTLENFFPENYHYRYRLEIRMNYHYRYRLGARSHPFISIDSQLPSRKSFELISSKLPLPLPS